MLNVIINENKIIESALKGEYDEKQIIPVLKALIKYYYLKGMEDKLQLREQILDFLKHNYDGYKRGKWENTVSKLVDSFLRLTKIHKIDPKIIEINKININKKELEYIEQLNDIKLEKLAFVMLVYAKVSNIITESTEGWINQSCSILCKEAKVNLKGEQKKKIFNELYKINYITQRKHNAKTNIKVCYIDEDSESEIIITDFEGVVHQYLIWKGERWKKCQECGKWIKITTGNNMYCKKCAKEIQRQQKRNYDKFKRKR